MENFALLGCKPAIRIVSSLNDYNKKQRNIWKQKDLRTMERYTNRRQCWWHSDTRET